VLRIYLAGPICLEEDGIVFDDWRSVGRQGRLAFALLAAEHRRAVPRVELAEELWLGMPPPSWERSLSAIISKLRTLLTRTQISGECIATAFGCCQLRLPGDAWIDLEAAAEGLDRAEAALRADDPGGAWGWAEVAYQVSRRPFLVGEEGPWVSRTREELRGVLVRAHEALSEIMVWRGETAIATKHAAEAVALEPFRETGYQRLMRAQAAAGNRAEALRTYERCCRLLAEELGVSPSIQTEAVYLDILRA
jgi:DNA-binding SARP family transcriptional activator